MGRIQRVLGIGILVEGAMEGIAREATPRFFREILGVEPERFQEEFLAWWSKKQP